MKASVSTYCHCRDDDRPHRPAEWERVQKKKETERKERPWRCIVNFKTDTVELHGGGGAGDGGWWSALRVRIVSPARYSFEAVFTPSPSHCHLCHYQWQAVLSQVKLRFVCGGIRFPRDPVGEVRFCCQSLLSDRKRMIYTCITTKWQDTIYCMCVLVNVQRSAG